MTDGSPPSTFEAIMWGLKQHAERDFCSSSQPFQLHRHSSQLHIRLRAVGRFAQGIDVWGPVSVTGPLVMSRGRLLIRRSLRMFGTQRTTRGLNSLSRRTLSAAAFPSLKNFLYVWAIANPLLLNSSFPPEISSVKVTTSTYSFPPSAKQPGTTATIDTGDCRIGGEVSYAGGFLYPALTTNTSVGYSGIYLWKIQPVLGHDNNTRCTGGFTNLCPDITSALLRNESLLVYGGGLSSFYPTQQPDPEGNVTTVLSVAERGQFTVIWFRRLHLAEGDPTVGNIRGWRYLFVPGPEPVPVGRLHRRRAELYERREPIRRRLVFCHVWRPNGYR